MESEQNVLFDYCVFLTITKFYDREVVKCMLLYAIKKDTDHKNIKDFMKC